MHTLWLYVLAFQSKGIISITTKYHPTTNSLLPFLLILFPLITHDGTSKGFLLHFLVLGQQGLPTLYAPQSVHRAKDIAGRGGRGGTGRGRGAGGWASLWEIVHLVPDIHGARWDIDPDTYFLVF